VVKHRARGGIRTRDPHVISVPHPPSVLPAPVFLSARGGIRTRTSRYRKPVLSPLNYAGARHRGGVVGWYRWRESNSHPQLRKLSLFPLSYRGLACRASAPGRVRTCNLRFRKPVRYPLRYGAWGDRRDLNPSTAESQTAVLPLHHDRHAGWVGRRPSHLLFPH
jgi:hypothetical protein